MFTGSGHLELSEFVGLVTPTGYKDDNDAMVHGYCKTNNHHHHHRRRRHHHHHYHHQQQQHHHHHTTTTTTTIIIIIIIIIVVVVVVVVIIIIIILSAIHAHSMQMASTTHTKHFHFEPLSSIDCYQLLRCCLSISFWVSLLLVFLLWVPILMFSWPTWCCSF